ncbi:MAG TPA: DUF4386 domain-containing protein [Actinomycetota bacterium]|nr:DUF4386 domain-containing protein [Actinomycetota bacterium]
MNSTRKTALAAGILFALTFITAIAGAIAYGPILTNARSILAAGAGTRVAWGTVFELLLVIANVGTALVLLPILTRHNEALALAYVVARVVEGLIIIVGALSLLSAVSLRPAGATGAEATSLLTTGRFLVAMHTGTSLLGPGLLGPGATGILLGWLLYRSGLVSRAMGCLGLIGGSLAVASGIAVLFGAYSLNSVWSGIATFPEVLWEGGVLSIWLIVKGFRAAPLTNELPAPSEGGPSRPLTAVAR